MTADRMSRSTQTKDWHPIEYIVNLSGFHDKHSAASLARSVVCFIRARRTSRVHPCPIRQAHCRLHGQEAVSSIINSDSLQPATALTVLTLDQCVTKA